MSPFELCQVANREELDQIVLVVWAAMENTDPSHSVFYPILTDGPESRNEAIKATQERIWQEHVSDPHSHWLYVRETKGVEMGTGKVVGGCQWRIYKENPFKGGIPEVNAHWWPEGESRAFASEVIRQLFNPRAIWMGRPHVG